MDFGKNAEHTVEMPHVPRSARRKRSSRKNDGQMCAFDLLATVAGKLLTEGDGSPFLAGISSASGSINPSKSCNVKDAQSIGAKMIKTEFLDRNSCNESPRISTYALAAVGPVSASLVPGNEEITGSCRRRGSGLTPEETGGRVSPDPHNVSMGDHVPGRCRLEDAMELDVEPPLSVSSGSGSERQICRSSSFPTVWGFSANRDDVDADDDKSSGCTYPTTVRTSKNFKQHFVCDRHRVKKLAPKLQKVTPPRIYKGEVLHNDVKMKHNFLGYTCPRTEKGAFKRRKLVKHCSVVTSDDAVLDSSARNANGTDGQVKLSIKSFKVPELVIEIPETATVGSLKRTVMEAVMSALGSGGLHIGVLLHGKKMRDDDETLSQAGISHGNKLNNLGFSLEPSCAEETRLSLPKLQTCDTFGETGIAHPVARLPTVEMPLEVMVPSCVSPPPTLNTSAEKDLENLRAIVPVPLKAEIPGTPAIRRPPKKPAQGQRRIRRPFSVTEVEALVQSVEKLGTGRWRDVKLQAFDTAKHRTYVDLKDKWKTLVHTASISPQQRRGEPVPQDLLDRVLVAQAYWSRQQAKIQPGTHQPENMLLGI